MEKSDFHVTLSLGVTTLSPGTEAGGPHGQDPLCREALLGATLTLATGGATAQIVTTLRARERRLGGRDRAGGVLLHPRGSLRRRGRNVHVPERGSSAHVRKSREPASSFAGAARLATRGHGYPRGAAQIPGSPRRGRCPTGRRRGRRTQNRKFDARWSGSRRSGPFTRTSWIGGPARDGPPAEPHVADEGDTIDPGGLASSSGSPAGVAPP